MRHAARVLHTITTMYHTRIFYSIAALLLIGSLAYLYFLASITFSVVSRKSIEEETKYRLAQVSSLEVAYLDKMESLTLQYAYAQGFTSISPTYIARDGVETRLTMRTHNEL